MKAFLAVLLFSALVGSAFSQHNLCIPETFSTAIYSIFSGSISTGQNIFRETVGQYYFDVTQQAAATVVTPIDANQGSYTVLTLFKTGTQYVYSEALNYCSKSQTSSSLSNCGNYNNITGPYLLGAVLDTWMASFENDNTSTTLLYDDKMNTPISTRASGTVVSNENTINFVDYTLLYNVSLSPISPDVFVPPSFCNASTSSPQKFVHVGGIKPFAFQL